MPLFTHSLTSAIKPSRKRKKPSLGKEELNTPGISKEEEKSIYFSLPTPAFTKPLPKYEEAKVANRKVEDVVTRRSERIEANAMMRDVDGGELREKLRHLEGWERGG